jgi:hypothetical protein
MCRQAGKWNLREIDICLCVRLKAQETIAGYEFGFLLEQSLGHITHAENLLTKCRS